MTGIAHLLRYFTFFVTSQARDILSSGSSFFLAVLCMMAVKKD